MPVKPCLQLQLMTVNKKPRLCHKKRLMLFLLKPERNNRQKASAVDSTKGNAEKRLYFHSTIEMKQPHTMTEPQ